MVPRMDQATHTRWPSLLDVIVTFSALALISSQSAALAASSVNSPHLENNEIQQAAAAPQLDARYYYLKNAEARDQYTTGPASANNNQNTSMTLYKEPSGWIVNILKELFNDIDWQAIDNARLQIEKFIHKVDRIVGSFRSIISKVGSGSSSSQAESGPRTPDGRWWNSGDKISAAMKADSTNVKQMLERVACYVGYVRLMNLSNEALAELDASKVVSNLFGEKSSGGAGGSKRNSSSMWSWLG